MKTVRSLSLLLLLSCGAASMAQRDPQRDFVMAGKDAFLMLPPEFVCGPTLRDFAWSQDGQHLAVLRDYADVPSSLMSDLILGKADTSEIEPETQVVVWSMVTHKATTLLKLKHSAGEVISLDWIAGTSSMIVDGMFTEQAETASGHRSLLVLNANGQTRLVKQFEARAQFEPIPSPTKPLVMLVEHAPAPEGDTAVAPVGARNGQVVTIDSLAKRPHATVRFFGPDGNLSEAITLPGPICIPRWGKDGSVTILSIEKKEGDKKASRVWYSLDQTTGKTTQLATAPAGAEEELQNQGNASGLAVENLSAQLADKKMGINVPTVTIGAIEAKPGEESVVTTDGVRGELSPGATGVSYSAQGSIMVRPLVKVSLEAYRNAKNAAIRQKILNQVKQVGLALLMYSNDYDDNFLANSGSWQSQLEPYLKNMNLLDGFNYTFTGGNAADIQNPASTQLGYIDGPGGRAVVYSDGHAKWIPNP